MRLSGGSEIQITEQNLLQNKAIDVNAPLQKTIEDDKEILHYEINELQRLTKCTKLSNISD